MGHFISVRLASPFFGLVLPTAGAVLGGGGAENARTIIDPTIVESMYVGPYYKDARYYRRFNRAFSGPQ